jgi:hypothetical protein
MNLQLGSASYNEQVKATFKKEGMALLRKTVKLLGLAKVSYDLRYNAGGIAVSGDCTLHSETFYVTFNLDFAGVLVRTCKGRKDYTGGPNRWYPFTLLQSDGAEGLAEFIRRIQ